MNAAQLGFWAILLAGAVRLATPITLAALGETLVERCGIVNLGVEGMMALGAFMGVWGASQQSWAVGLILGGAAGGFLGLLMGLAVLKGGVNQIVAGIAITLLGIGLADYFFQIWQPSGRSAVVVPLVPILRLPLARPAAIDWRGAVRAKPTELSGRRRGRRRKLGVAADDAGITSALRRRRSRSRAVARR